MNNLLFIGNPHTRHDLKTMRWFAAQPGTKVYLLSYPLAWKQLSTAQKVAFETEGIHLLGPLLHYSSLNLYRTRKEGKRIAELITHYKINCTFILYIAPGGLWASYRKSWKVPVILWAYGTDVNEVMESAFSGSAFKALADQRSYRKALASSDQVMAVSSGLIAKIKGWQPAARTLVLSTGVEVSRIQEAHRTEPLLEGKKYVLFPRFMRPVYHHELSVQAVSLLPADLLATYTFVFLDRESPDTAYRDKIRQLMEAAPQVRFLWLPAQDQEGIWSLYKQASLVVMHPHSDGTPVSALETMVCGVPLLLGPADYDPDLFASVPRIKSSEPQELATLMEQMLRQPPAAATLEAAKQNVVERTDIDKVLNRLQALMGSLG